MASKSLCISFEGRRTGCMAFSRTSLTLRLGNWTWLSHMRAKADFIVVREPHVLEHCGRLLLPNAQKHPLFARSYASRFVIQGPALCIGIRLLCSYYLAAVWWWGGVPSLHVAGLSMNALSYYQRTLASLFIFPEFIFSFWNFISFNWTYSCSFLL